MNYKETISFERKIYFPTRKEMLIHWITSTNRWKIWKYVVALRKEEHYTELCTGSKFYYLPLILSRRHKNRLGRMMCFDIPGGVFDQGLLIWHPGPIAVNPNARVGKNAVIVGNLCIGNNAGKEVAPQIGDNCTFGWGATLIGNIKIGDNCRIGSKAFVNHSFEENAVLVGIPAKNISKKVNKR